MPPASNDSARIRSYSSHSLRFFGGETSIRIRSPCQSGLLPVEQLVRHVVSRDHRDRRQARQFLSRPCQTQDRSVDRLQPRLHLRRALASSVCGSSSRTRSGRTLRPSGVVTFAPRTDPVIPPTVKIAPLARPPGSSATQSRPRPTRCRPALVRLPLAPTRLVLQHPHRVANLGKVRQQQSVRGQVS